MDPRTLRALCDRIAQGGAGGGRPSWTLIRWRALCSGNPRIARALWADSRGRIDDFHDLKIVTSLMSLTGDHARHEACLQRHDPGIRFADPSRQRRFHGMGVGGDSLNIYRLLEGPDGTSFEKTYRSDSPSLDALPFMHETVLPRIDGVRAPRLEHIERSDRLTVLRFQAVRMPAAPKLELERVAHTIARLARADLSGLEIPPALRDFERGHIGKFGKRLRDQIRHAYPDRSGEILAALKRRRREIRSLPVVPCHGDLNRHNFSADGHVIDWDLAGFYPHGYDAAYVAAKPWPYRDLAELRSLYATHFARAHGDPGDETAFLFFFLHFMQKFPRLSRNRKLFHELVQALELLPAHHRPRAAARDARSSRSAPSRRASRLPG